MFISVQNLQDLKGVSSSSLAMRISVEGNVGSGKSSLLAHLSEKGWRVHQEPVDEWESILQLFYKNHQRWALTMTSCALYSFCDIPESDINGDPVVVERSPLSCKEVFARLHKNEGVMSEKEWCLLSDLFAYCGWVPDVIIYLVTPTATCLERTRKRGRQSEQHVSHDYLAKIQFAHNTMLRWYDGQIHIVDASQEAEHVHAQVDDLLAAYRELTEDTNQTKQ